jgi:hypothetical protein
VTFAARLIENSKLGKENPMRLDSNEQLKTIAGFVAELILAIKDRSPLKQENFFEEYLRARDLHMDVIGEEIAETRRRAKTESARKTMK